MYITLLFLQTLKVKMVQNKSHLNHKTARNKCFSHNQLNKVLLLRFTQNLISQNTKTM